MIGQSCLKNLLYMNEWIFPIDYLRVAPIFFNRLSLNYCQLRNPLRATTERVLETIHEKFTSLIAVFMPLEAMLINRLNRFSGFSIYCTRALFLQNLNFLTQRSRRDYGHKF